MKGIQNTVTAVTGGASGIGEAVCYRLVEEGGYVGIIDVDASSGLKLADHLGKQAFYIEADISTEPGSQVAMLNTFEKFGCITGLVNSAANFKMIGLDATAEDWQAAMQVNVIGTALATKYAARHMQKNGGGAVVNLSSISGIVAQPEFLTYSAGKGAVLAMTRCMAADLAPYKIRVNSVCPGTIWTSHVETYMHEVHQLDKTAVNQHNEFGARYMLKRIGDPAEVAAAIVFLLSDDASFITGEKLMVDGGYVAA